MKQPEILLRVFAPVTFRQFLQRTCTIVLLLAGLGAPALIGQDTKRAEATREELQASLTELEQYIASSGYSGRLRAEKRREAEMIRARLEDGDIQVGDQIDLMVVGETALTGVFTVTSGRILTLPGLPDIPLRGVLRSEAREYLRAQIGKYIREPQVRVRTTIRLSVFGQVGKPGFYQIPADVVVTDAFMAAGGPSGNANLSKAFVRRGTEQIWTGETFRSAMQRGLTLDQLNLRAGDELVLDPQGAVRRFNFFAVIGALGAITSTYYLVSRIF